MPSSFCQHKQLYCILSIENEKKKKFNENKYAPKGLGTVHYQSPVCVMLPPELDKIVRSLENRSEFIRNAIAEKVKREGLDKCS